MDSFWCTPGYALKMSQMILPQMLTEPWLNFRLVAVTICHNDLVCCQNLGVINRPSQASPSPGKNCRNHV